MKHSSERRRILVWMGAAALAPLAATPALAEERPVTPSMTEGPFYPRTFPKDSDADLTRVGGRAERASGTLLDVSGRVVDRSGRPRAGARVEIWQCDSRGAYHHVGGTESDPNFQGFGAVSTDADGRYGFRTIKPVPYPGRTPHIPSLSSRTASAASPRRCSSRANRGTSAMGSTATSAATRSW